MLVIAYYMRQDYCIVSTVYIHFFTSFYAFFLHVMYSSSNSLRFLGFHYDFWSFGGFSVFYVLTNQGDPHGYRDAWGRRIAARSSDGA